MPKKILIVEDEPKISEFIASYIEASGYKAYCATNGKDALKLYNSNSIDLVLLDLMLPDMSGESICMTLRTLTDIPIIMITAKSDEESIIKGLEMGADDYITKPFSPRQLLARIYALFRRVESVQKINYGPFEIIEEQYIIKFNSQNLGLTVTEFTLFSSILKRPTKIFTRDELASTMHNKEYDGFLRSIDSHIKNIRQKLSALTDTNYIKTVRGIGYQFNADESGD